jgi:hypothetical protein
MKGRQEPDRVQGKIVVLTFAGTVVIASIAVAAEAILLARARPPPELRAAEPRHVASVGSIQQRPFERPAVGLELKAEQKRRLESYGWVDRNRGVVHLPIERAMDWSLELGQDPARHSAPFEKKSGKPAEADVQRGERRRSRRDRTSTPGASP